MLAEATITDAELVQLAQDGDVDAFRELFERHRPRVTAVCRQRLRSPSDVDDAVQEAFVRALTKLHQLREHGNFGAWIRSIAVRACIDHHRGAQRVILVDDDTHGEVPDHSALPEDMLLAAERGASLRATFAELGERDRRALWMRHVNEAPVSAVAMELGLTEGSTRVLLTRARHRLRAATASLPALVPLSWRQWLRDHLPVTTPALDAVVVAVTLTIAGAAGAGAFAPAEAAVTTRPTTAIEQQDPAAGRSADRPAQRPVRERRLRSAAPPAGAGVPPAEAGAERGRPFSNLRSPVQIRSSKPSPEETDELVDLTVFAAGTDVADEQENTVTLYGREVAPIVDEARRRQQALGLASDADDSDD